MSVRSVCLGWHWRPYVYSKTADDTDGAPVRPLPREIALLARRAVAEAYGAESPAAASYAPDAAIVNLCESGSRLALHRDWEEPADAPVVTLSIGATARADAPRCRAALATVAGPRTSAPRRAP